MTNKVFPIVNEEKDEALPSSIIGLYDLNWREYLKIKNYDRDISTMCQKCKKEQMIKFGKTTIKCSGLRRIETMLPEEIINEFNDQELITMKELVDPYYWAENHIDVHQENPERRVFSKRWYQERIVSCSASRKVVRCGRRIGKSYALALDATHRLVNNPGYRILVVTPYLTQAKELAELVRKMLKHLDTGSWSDIVERSVSSPNHEIKLRNGSVFKAFTAGGGDAGAVRGQGADWIIIDEADFISQPAYNAIVAILADTPNTELTCTSTPFGENILFKLSKAPEYKEFHYPTSVLPHYDDSLDDDIRNQTDVVGYIQEYMAEWGLDSNVVFQPEFIDRARIDEIPDPSDYIVNRSNYILALGCDWNGDKVGTRICIVAYSKVTGKISIAKMDNVIKEGWTQLAAVQKIIELNRLYTPDHIYVDEGFGESNVQALKYHAVSNYGKLPKDHPDLRLDEVVAVNFAATLELRDVVTGEIRKKYYKNFIVETVNRALETNTLLLGGTISQPIVDQMKNYVVKTTTANGRKVYEAKNSEIGDHDLDAFMIGITALHLEHDSILDLREISTIQILPVERNETRGYNESSSISGRMSNEQLSGIASSLFYSYKNNMPRVGRTDAITSSKPGVLGRSRITTNSGNSRSRVLTGRQR